MEIISVVSNAKTKKGRSSSGPFEIRYQEAAFIMPIRRVRALETPYTARWRIPARPLHLSGGELLHNQWDQLAVESHREGYGPGAKYVWHAWRPDPAGTRTWYQPGTWGGGCGVPQIRC